MAKTKKSEKKEEDVPAKDVTKKEKKSKKDKADKKSAKGDKKEKVKKEKSEKKSKKEKKARKADDEGEETPKKKKKKTKEVEEEKEDSDSDAPAAEEESTEMDTAADEPAETEASGGAPPANNPDGISKCFLGNLSWDIDDDATKAFFKDCGEAQEIFWLTDKESGKFKGAGFITFTTPEAASKAVALNGVELMGRPIKVEFASQRPASTGARSPAGGRKFEMSEKPEGCVTIFLGNLSWDIDDDACKKFFEDCGEVKKIRWLTDRESGQFKGCGFVDFYETESVDKAAKKNGIDLMGRAVRIDYAKARPPREF